MSHRTRLRCEAGSVEVAVVLPALLVLVFGTVNAAWWFHARDVAAAAARAGVEQGRLQGSNPAAGVSAAASFAAGVGAGALDHPTVSAAGSGPTRVCVSVSGIAPLMIPLLPQLRVTQRACAPTERLTR